MPMKKIWMLLSIPLLMGSCENKAQSTGETGTVQTTQVEPIQLANLDTTVAPCENFYQYANGGWIKNNPAPPSESRWGSFNELYDRNQKILREVVEKASEEEATKGSVAQLVGDFYQAGMDSATTEKMGIKPIQEDLKRIAAIKDKEEVLRVLGYLKKKGVGAGFRAYVYIDDKNSEQNITQFNQGGLGMPDRDYYLKDDENKNKIKTAYLTYIQTLLKLAGATEEEANAQAAQIVAFETKLAEASKSRVALRDPVANYNKMTVAELDAQMPNVDVKMLLAEMSLQKAEEVIVGQPDFFKAFDGLVASASLEEWKSYLRWHFLRRTAPYLSHDFVKAHFQFTQTALRGTKEMKPRWKRVLAQTDRALGEALGQLFVKKAFTPQAKEKMMTLIDNLQYAFEVHINELDWMSDATKKEAQIKLAAFKRKIGYPDKWKDYTGLEITPKSYWQNISAVSQFTHQKMIEKLGKPVDKSEWFMSPPTVNAYYNPPVNEIVFPAGILQPPFFYAEADDAVNYGAIGAVIGHELSHGFDDQGRQYDAKGNLRDWWQASDATQFKEKADKVVAQYSSYEVLPDVKINGALTLGENIADLGGLAIAYTALQKALEGKEVKKINGFTPAQRFFISWAQVWRTNATDEFLKQQVQTDPHSPAKFRVNVPVSNMPAFYEAFGCEQGDALHRPAEERLKIW